MTCSRSVLLSAAMILGIVAAGCASSGSSMSRIEADRATYESWPLDIQQAVLEQRVVAGMTHEQVEMAVGKPAAKTARNTRKGTEEVWVYREGGNGKGLGGMPITIGGMAGGVGMQRTSGGSSGGEEYEVVFVDGQVVRSTIPQ